MLEFNVSLKALHRHHQTDHIKPKRIQLSGLKIRLFFVAYGNRKTGRARFIIKRGIGAPFICAGAFSGRSLQFLASEQNKGEIMKKLLLLPLVAIGLALIPMKQAEAQVSVGIGPVGIGVGYPAYGYGYPRYGYYPRSYYSYYRGYPNYRTYGRPYYGGHRYYKHHKRYYYHY